jgi:excisionase family DNA binding protein
MEPIAHTIPEAVKLSGHSRTRIYNLLAEGKLRAVRSGKRTLVLHDSLKAYVASLPAYKPQR